jgi:LPXTG-site transpeptidase (sortase) family protein
MSWEQIAEAVLQRKTRFITTFFFVFLGMYIFLYIVDFLPEAPTEQTTTIAPERVIEVADVTESEREQMSDSTDVPQSVTAAPVTISDIDTVTVETGFVAPQASTQDLPVSMYIEKLGRTVEVLNPVSRTIADLDTALLDGAVRHPDSAAPNQDGNVFILGHSSYLPNVFNRNFQAFNGIQNLQWGDTITLTSDDAVYTYRVEKVYKARASDITVPIAGTSQLLTLATCNSFGSTDDRYIVEATLQKTEAA